MGRQQIGLTRLFAALVPTLVPACGDKPIDEDQFSDDLCDEAGFHILQAIEPASAIDAVSLREVDVEGYDGMQEQLGEPRMLDADGQLCSGASDAAACAAAVAALPYASSIGGPSGEFDTDSSLAYTRGDEVGGVTTLDGLLAFLGPIDAPGDAALLTVLTEHQLVCDDGNEVGARGEDWVVFTRSGGGCGEGDDVEHHVLLVRADGSTKIIQTELIERGDPGCAVGRLPAGLCRARIAARARSPVGAFLAEVAELEAASITAFEQLARELVLHGAPRPLVAAALAARQDEIRHARVTARHARRWGGRPRVPKVAAQAPRSLVDVAVDNAIEGCIRETFGAASAHLCARQAGDPALRRSFAAIAIDETRHAALSWSLAQWLDTRLGAAGRRQVARRRADALLRLEPELTASREPEVHAMTGLPNTRQARALYRRLGATLAA